MPATQKPLKHRPSRVLAASDARFEISNVRKKDALMHNEAFAFAHYTAVCALARGGTDPDIRRIDCGKAARRLLIKRGRLAGDEKE